MGVLKQAVSDRLKGDRPSPLRALLAAVSAGVVVAVTTYRVLRG